mmetsp:Transcript_18979/g.28141  ORF Transcript_18979/g.28141 Transcript_18979/m.28141 type:complete len:363 (+) Transcript_18979:41-1129(+)
MATTKNAPTDIYMIEQKHTKKRPAKIIVGPAAKKRRGLVSRTHSPRSESSPLSSVYTNKSVEAPPDQYSLQVRKISPTLQGVTEAARLLGGGSIVVIPTESVYMACTSFCPLDISSQRSLRLLREHCSYATRQSPTFLVKNPVSSLNRLVRLLPKPYAIQEKDGKATLPAVFSELQEIVSRLGRKFWPGPLIMHVKTDRGFLPTRHAEGDSYISISNPSHPLTNRMLTGASSLGRILATFPSLRKNDYMTNASEVCSYYSSKLPSENTTIHVLNGEDKRELFSVPTCQCKPLSGSLWIDDTSRTIFIRGSKANEDTDIFNVNCVKRAVRCLSPSPTEDERLKNRNRVITAVLCKWKVSDQRS